MAVAMRFFISFYLSRDKKEQLWLDLMGMQTREPNLPVLVQCGPVFVTLTDCSPWELSQLDFPAP